MTSGIFTDQNKRHFFYNFFLGVGCSTLRLKCMCARILNAAPLPSNIHSEATHYMTESNSNFDCLIQQQQQKTVKMFVIELILGMASLYKNKFSHPSGKFEFSSLRQQDVRMTISATSIEKLKREFSRIHPMLKLFKKKIISNKMQNLQIVQFHYYGEFHRNCIKIRL